MSAADEEARRVAWLAQQQKRLAFLAHDQAVILAGSPTARMANYDNWQPLLLALQEERMGPQPLEWRPTQVI